MLRARPAPGGAPRGRCCARPAAAGRPAAAAAGLATRAVVAATMSSNDFRNGVTIELDGAPWRVQEFLHVKPGKGSAFVRTKIKNLITGNQQDKTFRAGEKVQTASVFRSDGQYTYKEGDDYVFMDMETYEETRVPEDPAWAKYLKEGETAKIVKWDDKVIGVEPPKTVTLEVVDTEPGVKGNTKQGGDKPATTETGAVFTVPLFIQIGEKIVVDCESGKYISRGE